MIYVSDVNDEYILVTDTKDGKVARFTREEVTDEIVGVKDDKYFALTEESAVYHTRLKFITGLDLYIDKDKVLRCLDFEECGSGKYNIDLDRVANHVDLDYLNGKAKNVTFSLNDSLAVDLLNYYIPYPDTGAKYDISGVSDKLALNFVYAKQNVYLYEGIDFNSIMDKDTIRLKYFYIVMLVGGEYIQEQPFELDEFSSHWWSGVLRQFKEYLGVDISVVWDRYFKRNGSKFFPQLKSEVDLFIIEFSKRLNESGLIDSNDVKEWLSHLHNGINSDSILDFIHLLNVLDFYGSTIVWQVIWLYHYTVSQPSEKVAEIMKGVEDVICQCCE